MKFERTRATECLSDLAFDQWRAGEYQGVDPQPHVESCPRCEARLLAIDTDRELFRAQMPAFSRPLRPRKPTLGDRIRQWLPAAVPVMVAAAVLLLWIRSGSETGLATTDANDQLETTRRKGGPSIGYYVKRGQEVRLGAVHETLLPNDAVRFLYSSSQDRYLVIASLDGSNEVTIYYAQGAHAAAVGAGTDVALQESVILDHVLGTESVFGFFCEDPVSTAMVRAALRDEAKEPLMEGCSVSTLQWEKIAP